jgi:Xaa-Pro aminopeptidase
MKNLTLLLGACFIFQFSSAQYTTLFSQRDRARLIDEMTDDRLLTLLPALMRKEGIDMWVIVSRENNEDPVMKTLMPANWLSARGTTMLVIFDRATTQETEYLAITRHDPGKIFKRAWDPDHQPDQWAQLVKIIGERNPAKIAVNKSEHFGLADGITATELDQLKKALHNKKLSEHIVSAERLAIAWLETRSEREMIIYQQVCRLAHEIILEGTSDKVVVPGITTTEDLSWWYREKVKELKIDTWFHPVVSLQRNEPDVTFNKRTQPLVIMPGDLLHVDFGISYLRLNTHMQNHAYILKPGESEAPDFLRRAIARANKLQDIVTRNFQEGKTGNQILADSRKQATDQGITPFIHTHPIGFHGNGAGPTIGLWDMQNGVPRNGEYTVNFNTAYGIELAVSVFIIEWKKEIQIRLEEDGFFDASGFRYIDGRQMDLITIPRSLATK